MKRPGSDRMRAKRSLGQNFLSDPNYVDKIVKAANASPGDNVIEIGPGRGALTARLLETGARVVAIELDRDLIEPLQAAFGGRETFHLVEQDALTVDLQELLDEGPIDAMRKATVPAKVVANLPYYISTAILQRLAAQRSYFSALVLMFQREVVDRILAPPGNSERGYLTVLTETAFDVEKLFDVPPAAFRPVPKVRSAVVRLTPKPAIDDEEAFRRLVSIGFAQKRKTIANNLKTAFPNYTEALREAGIDPKARAEELTLEQWHRLHRAVAAA